MGFYNDVEEFKTCACCKKEFSMLPYYAKEYVYKHTKKGVTSWYCSYPCYRKGDSNERNRLCSDNGRSEESNSI